MKLRLQPLKNWIEATFINREKVDERQIYDSALQKLRENESVEFKDEIMGPSEDIIIGAYNDEWFSLIHDLDYGTSIRCESKKAINSLVALLEA